MFIRTKHVKDKPYAYLVENEWVDGSPKQSVKQYLGRIYEVDELPAPDLSDVPADQLLEHVIEYETQDVAVKIDLDERSVTKSGRDVVLALNGGYLCAHTLERVFKARFARNEERPGVALAEAISRAGLRVDKQSFVRLYMEFAP